MSLLIDGYNLIFGTNIESRGRGGALQRMRTGLLEFVAARIDRTRYKSIAIVFDAASAPPGLPTYFQEHGVDVHFARDHESADALLEELIARSTSPGRLTVVSSDHRVQRAAKRRGATAIDSEVWLRKELAIANRKPRPVDRKPPAPLNSIETKAWMEYFGDVEIAEAMSIELEIKSPPPKSEPPPPKRRRRNKSAAQKPLSEKPYDPSLANPFPPGYADDLFNGADI